MEQTRTEAFRGMRDISPAECAIRDELWERIRTTYASWGYERIETPALERIDVLVGSRGGDNEKLIFQILKRGDKLASATDANEMIDGGLRFDLTVPLARFMAAHNGKIALPFRSLQFGPVWRAERPQKGRFRQFNQCDVDLIGMDAPFAELELTLATSTCLSRIGLDGFTVRINDRRILTALCAKAGYSDQQRDTVLVILDKVDKIGREGVLKELLALDGGSEPAAHFIDRALAVAGEKEMTPQSFVAQLALEIPESVAADLALVGDEVKRVGGAKWTSAFDPTLVRGMGYYTGMIFEVSHPGYGYALAGGGRYDEMIGRFLSKSVPAAGFSIGFERIVVALMEQNVPLRKQVERVALLAETPQAATAAHEEARKIRSDGGTAIVQPKRNPKKVGKQIQELREMGYQKVLFVTGEGQVMETK